MGKKEEWAERLAGWQKLPNGDIAYLPFVASAVLPMAQGVGLAIRFVGSRSGQTQPQQLQVVVGLQDARELARLILAAADDVEREMTPPDVTN